MCQFSACHPGDESGHGLFQPLDPKAAAAVQGGWWAYHLDHGHHAQLVSGSYHSSGHHGYGGPTPSFSSPPHISPVEESVSTYGYSYGYGTDF